MGLQQWIACQAIDDAMEASSMESTTGLEAELEGVFDFEGSL
jgi:hypothetical protein